jgi:hypothetical protein
LLVVLAVPFAVVLLLLLLRRPRAGLVLMVLMSGLVFAVLVVNIIQSGFARQGWADYLYAYVGAPVAAVGMDRRFHIAGRRWTIEKRLQAGKGLVGLDQHQITIYGWSTRGRS